MRSNTHTPKTGDVLTFNSIRPPKKLFAEESLQAPPRFLVLLLPPVLPPRSESPENPRRPSLFHILFPPDLFFFSPSLSVVYLAI